jgi:regulator of protease activity HflC (stomatin/prohibitin superfamily)
MSQSPGLGSYIAIIVTLAVIFLILIRNIRIVPQATNFIIERLGAYHSTWPVGIHMKIPFIDRVVKVVSLKEKVADFQPQAVIT